MAVAEAESRLEARLAGLITAGSVHRGLAKNPDALAVIAAFAAVIPRAAVDAVQELTLVREAVLAGGADRVTTAQAMEYLARVDEVLHGLPEPGKPD